MLYLIVLFFIITIILTYKNLDSLSTRFLYGIILGWITSLVSLILYLSKHNYYFHIMTRVFSFNRSTWNMLVSLNLNPDHLIRMLNMGVALFIYSVIGFAIAFTRRKMPKHKSTRIYLFLLVIPLIQVLFYDPYVYKLSDSIFRASYESGSIFYSRIILVLSPFFRFFNFAYLLAAFCIFYAYYRNHPNIRFLKNYTLFNILCLLPIVILYFLIFSWTPKMLLKSTMVYDYYNYTIPDISEYILFLNLLPYIALLFSAVMVYSIFRYNTIETYYKKHDVHISKSIDTATLGVRAFTHSMKNHLLAIRSEAEFLMEKCKNDNEAIYSLNLILDSCNRSFDSINTAAVRLKNIRLNLQPTLLNVPIDNAVSRFIPVKSDINIVVNYPKEIPVSYIDMEQFSETLYNIIDNAAESIIENTDNIHSRQEIKIVVEAQNNWGVITISDTGCGISGEYIDKIYNPFFTTKSSVNKWGIGLSYCHKIINAHDGKISVESKLGEGTTFKIALPIL